jgi:hypothetical protein
MKYKAIVDDIQIQFKSHNESIKTQNPYWILFRLITEITAVRDELLQKIADIASVPEWMISTSLPLSPTISNSSGLSGNFDNIKFSRYTVPEYYPLFSTGGILSVDSMMKQTQIFLDDYRTVMLRIKADDTSLEDYVYGFVDLTKLFLYPPIGKVVVKYIPLRFGEEFDAITEETVINAPDFIIREARNRVVESVLLQKQIPEDDTPNQQDDGVPGGGSRKTRQ